MENKKTLLLIAGCLVVLLGGASVLYNRLGSMVNREMLQTQEVMENRGEAGHGEPDGDGNRSQGGSAPGRSDQTELEGGQTVGVDGNQEGGGTAGNQSDKSAAESQGGSSQEGQTEATSPGTAGEAGTTQQPAAPDFTVEDTDGNPVKLSDLVGKPVVLNFWASWCPPCKSEMPDFDEVFSEYGDKVQFMMVNLTDGSRETVDTARKYVEDHGFSFPVYFDTESEAAIVYGIMAVPATFFIDAEGRPVARASGAIDKETLKKGIGMVLPEEGTS